MYCFLKVCLSLTIKLKHVALINHVTLSLVAVAINLSSKSRIQAKSGPHVEYEASPFSAIPGLCARVQTLRLRGRVG